MKKKSSLKAFLFLIFLILQQMVFAQPYYKFETIDTHSLPSSDCAIEINPNLFLLPSDQDLHPKIISERSEKSLPSWYIQQPLNIGHVIEEPSYSQLRERGPMVISPSYGSDSSLGCIDDEICFGMSPTAFLETATRLLKAKGYRMSVENNSSAKFYFRTHIVPWASQIGRATTSYDLDYETLLNYNDAVQFAFYDELYYEYIDDQKQRRQFLIYHNHYRERSMILQNEDNCLNGTSKCALNGYQRQAMSIFQRLTFIEEMPQCHELMKTLPSVNESNAE